MDWNKRFLFMLLMIMTFISGSDLLAQVEGVTGRSDHITGQVFDQQGGAIGRSRCLCEEKS